jgi:hypothetical protein
MSRRAVLGLVAVTLVACGKKRKPPTPTPVVVPDAEALADARAREAQLLAWYDQAIATALVHQRPALQVERAIHATHRSALHAAPVTSTDLPAVAPAVTNVRRALRTSARQLRRAALTATEGNNAALLASIAASHEASVA